MSRIVSAALLLGAVTVVSVAVEPQSLSAPDRTLPVVIDTTGCSVYRYEDTAGDYLTTALPDTQTRGIELSEEKTTVIKKELKSASGIAKTGATLFGFGFAADLIGTIIFIKDASKYHYSSATPMAGYYISLGGGVTELIGTIVANSGGSKARNILEITYGNAAPFKGWGYFWTGFVCTVAGNVITMTELEVPVVLPITLSVGSYIFYITSVIHSVNYSNKAYLRSVVLRDLRISPMVDMRSFKPNGLIISGSF
jgi:hypothetical protein